MFRTVPRDGSTCLRFAFVPAFFAGCLAASYGPVYGQGNQRVIRPQVYEIPKNGIFDSRSQSSPVATPRGSLPPASHRVLSRKEKRSLMQLAARVDGASETAFRRGLMDLDDFGMHQDVVFRLRLAAQSDGGGGNDRTALLAARVRRFDRAAEQLRRMNQPAATGWAASLAQAQLMATNARIELALDRGDRSSTPILAERSIELARKFYRLRKQDYDIGRADDRKMANAIADTVGARKQPAPGASISQPSERIRAALAERVARDAALAKRPAGDTRPDNFAEARFQLAEAQAFAALASGKTAASKVAAMHADRESRQQFQHLVRFSQAGTASLFDMTRAWLRRDTLQRAVIHGGVEATADMLEARKRDLGILRDAAASIKDARGRNAADVALVQSLQLLESAQPLSVRRTIPRSTPPSTNGESRVKPRIVDLSYLRKKAKQANNE